MTANYLHKYVRDNKTPILLHREQYVVNISSYSTQIKLVIIHTILAPSITFIIIHYIIPYGTTENIHTYSFKDNNFNSLRFLLISKFSPSLYICVCMYGKMAL